MVPAYADPPYPGQAMRHYGCEEQAWVEWQAMPPTGKMEGSLAHPS